MASIKQYIVLVLCIIIISSCSAQNKIPDTKSNAKISLSEQAVTTKALTSEQEIADDQTEEKTISLSPVKDEYYSNNYIRYENFIYNDNIQTVLFYRDGNELSPPLYDINTQDKLRLSFDDFGKDVNNYKFYIIHCDADWIPSNISDYEYITGFKEDFITDYKFSHNTRQSYIHYDLMFPNDNFQIISPGNYLLAVYTDDNKEHVILTRRFWIVDPKVSVNVIIKGATKIDDANYKQELDFIVIKNTYEIYNPYSDLKVMINQNGRWDNALKDIKPQIVKDNIIDYNFNGEITFNGGNEFRRFDIKSLRYNSERIANITVDSASKKFIVYLFRDERRTFKQYLSDADINGRFYIKDEDNATDSDIEGDYVWVHFTMPYSAPFVDGDLYILGALSDWRYSKSNKMAYDYPNKAYVANLYVKQGYYNYQYVFLPNNQKTGDETVIEGNHFETENEYTIYIYNREPGTIFDKLIGLKQINTAHQ